MSVFDFFERLFGSSHGGNGRPPEFGERDNFNFNKQNGPLWSPDPENDDVKHFSSLFDFNVMTDPFEMHQFFEEKINEVMKSFMSSEGFPAFQGFGTFESPPVVPAIPDSHDPRDHYLKPGAKVTPPSEKSRDERSGPTTTWLDKFTPGQEGNRSFSSFRSVIRKTVILPDGTMKTEEVIRNSGGPEEGTMSDGSSSPFVGPDLPGLFGLPKVPEYKDPRYQFLKPGYEKFNPNSEKIDKDLDKQIEQAGIGSLPPFTKEPEISQPNMSTTFRSVTRRIVTLPNGVVESEEIISKPDGTEERTVTHTWPDGTAKSITVPTNESLFTGQTKDNLMEAYDKPVLSFALRGVKDFIDMLFK